MVPISLNVSRVDILACDVAEHMGALAAQYNLPPELMHIEITETAYTGESEAVDRLTADLHTRGFSTYMDDFGTGQSTLAMLKNVNVDVIKLDRTFVPVDGDQGRSVQIISSMLEMAQSLHLPVVVEGIETNEQATCYAKWAPATLRASSTTVPCRRRILRHCSMVATATNALVRKRHRRGSVCSHELTNTPI